MSKIANLEQRIREEINKSSYIFQRLIEAGDWGRVCSAMDMLGDSEVAFDGWLHASDVENLGLRYIMIFGVLQVLFVQQDAAIRLCSAFGVNPSKMLSAELREIREIRNPSVGHPVLRDDGSSHHITRATLSSRGFQMASYWPDGRSQYWSVNLRDLVTKQRKLLTPLLQETLQQVIAWENEHRQRFRDDRLASEINDYLLQNLWRAVHEVDRAPMGPSTIEMVRENIAAFETGLLERIPASPIAEELGSIRHGLDRLTSYFQIAAPTEMDRKDADLFVSHVVDRLRHLRDIAAEIDSDFERDVA